MKRFLIPLIFLGLVWNLWAESAEEIVQKADDAMDYTSAYMEARMVNRDQFGAKTINYRAWARGDSFLMEFTSDAEFGQKILRTQDRIYHFFPDSEAVFTKSRGDSIVGLISYEDVTNETGILETYDVVLEGEERLNGIDCYKISMGVKKGKRAAYPLQMVWIGKGTYTIHRMEMFTRGGKPLKTMEIRRVDLIGGKQIAVDILLTDDVRKGVTSEIFIDRAELNLSIDEGKFTRRELTR